jgi:biotin carboxyl carrier protein
VKIEIQLRGVKKTVEIRSNNGKLQFFINGRALQADAVQNAEGIYSILLGGQSFEARIETRGPYLAVNVDGREFIAEIRDPRRFMHGRTGAVEAEGKQQVLAPMPGKIVRVLAAAGEAIESNKGLVVIEAMKMQNEVRSPKSGIVELMLVVEGQAVGSGDVLAVIA